MSNNYLAKIEAMKKGLLSVEEERNLAADLGACTDSESEVALLALLGSHDSIVRYNSIVALGFERRILKAAQSFMSIAVSDPDEDCRDAAVSVLGSMFQNTKDHELLAVLGSVAIQDGDESVRRSAHKAALMVNGVCRGEHPTMMLFFGPVSSATPNGGGPFWNILIILVAIIVLVRVWTKYRESESGTDQRETTGVVVGMTLICVVMIVLGIFGLLR